MATTTDTRPEDADLPDGWEDWGPHQIRRHCGTTAARIDEITNADGGGRSLLQQATIDEANGEAAYKHTLNSEILRQVDAGESFNIAKARGEVKANNALRTWKLAEGQRRAVREELESLRSVLSALQTLFKDVMRQAGR